MSLGEVEEIREIGFDPVVIGGLAMGKYLVPGMPLGGEHTAAEIRQIVTNLQAALAASPTACCALNVRFEL